VGTKIGKNWGEATIASDITVDGDLTKQLLQFNYQGVVLDAPVNLVGFEKLHIDLFQTDQTQIKLSIIHQGGADITKLLVIANPGWNSFDLPLSNFAGLNLATVYQLKLEGAPTQGNTTVFFDNLYFHKGTSSTTDNQTAANLRVYPNPFKNDLTIDAIGTISKVAVFNVFGQEMLSFWPNTVSATLPLDGLAVGVYFVEVLVDGRVGVVRVFRG
jgi:Secretion system C-terminal sorting domain